MNPAAERLVDVKGDGEPTLRPQTLGEFIGQRTIRENLRVFIRAARERQEALDHVLLFGPPGLGKTTLAQIIARELGVGFRATSGPVIARAGDLAAILTNIERHDVLFIDEIHRLAPAVEEILYPAMEDYQLDLIIGEGPAARSIRLDLPPFTLIGATTRSGLLTTPLRERFGIPLRLELYKPEELAEIVARGARLLNVPMTADGSAEIARRARGTPRVAGRLLRRVRDFAAMDAKGPIDAVAADAALMRLEVDRDGLDSMDRRYLRCIAEHYSGGPVGVETLSAALGEQRDVIEEVIEPFLVQQGLVHRTPRGRMLASGAYRVLGLPQPPQAAVPQFDLPLGTEDDAWQPATDGSVHVWPIRVYYEDTDAGGVVYYANYLKFAERARSEILRAAGFDHGRLAAEQGIGVVVRSCAIEFLLPARLDDALEVRSRIATMSGASFTIWQEIFRSNEMLVRADIRLACIAGARPVRLPAVLTNALAPYKCHITG